MLQIKTIQMTDPDAFDAAVNKALEEGWTLVHRRSHMFFTAELERDIITEAERTCDNCARCDNDPDVEPCASCSEDCDKWEAADA